MRSVAMGTISKSMLSLALVWACGAAVAEPVGVAQMAWLSGCWQGQFGEAGTQEQWMAPAGGSMLGMSRTVRKGRTVEFEFMQVREQADGGLVFVAQPSGRPPTVFRLLKLAPGEAVFESPEHDFPQRVRYARVSDTQLAASIEGLRNGQLRRIDFAFNRVPCDSSGAESPR
jgi:Domain of unknown function (DUF6265)